MKKYFGTVTDREGNAASGAEVYVRVQATSALASLFSDNGVTATANPTVTNNNGHFEFYVADGLYKLEFYTGGVEQYEEPNVQIYDDEDNEIKALRSVTSAADKGFRFTGSGTGATYDLTAGGIALAGLTGAADKGIQFTGASTAATYDLTAAGKALLDDANAAAQRTTLGLGSIATFDEATAAQYRNNTADKALSTDQVWSSADYVALTDAATIAVDFSAGFNFSVTLADNRTLGAPSNTKNGQVGAIVITQDGTGSRTLAFHANWKFAGGGDPVLSTAAGTVDVLFYQVISSTFIYANLVKAIA